MSKKRIYSIAFLTTTLLMQASEMKVGVEMECSVCSVSALPSPSGHVIEQSRLQSANAMPEGAAQAANNVQLSFSIKDEVSRWNDIKKIEKKIEEDACAVTAYLNRNKWLLRKQIELYAPLLSESHYQSLASIALKQSIMSVAQLAITQHNADNLYRNVNAKDDFISALQNNFAYEKGINRELNKDTEHIAEQAAILQEDAKKVIDGYIQLDQIAQKWIDSLLDVDLPDKKRFRHYFEIEEEFNRYIRNQCAILENSSIRYKSWKSSWDEEHTLQNACELYFKKLKDKELKEKKLKHSSCVVQ